jgi:hypothetical protein
LRSGKHTEVVYQFSASQLCNRLDVQVQGRCARFGLIRWHELALAAEALLRSSRSRVKSD